MACSYSVIWYDVHIYQGTHYLCLLTSYHTKNTFVTTDGLKMTKSVGCACVLNEIYDWFVVCV